MQQATKSNAPAKPITREHLSDALCVLFLLLLTVVLFREGLFAPSPVVLAHHAHSDLTHQFYPWRLFAFSMLKEGIIPLWNPYLYCGYPFVADWSSAIFYPLNLIFLCLPVHTSINWSFVLHIFLSGMFTYFFMRYVSGSRFGSLVSSLTFMFSATLILRILAGHLSIICTIPWFPAELLALEAGLRTRRLRYFILGGVALAMQLLAGYPQCMYYSLVGLLLYFALRLFWVVREKKKQKSIIGLCACFAVLIGIGLSLGAVQLLPGLEFIQHSSRGKLLDFKEATVNSFPPENIITFLVPNAFGDFIRVFCWGRCYLWEAAVYIGILPLSLVLLALCCVRNRFVYIFSAIAILSFLIALGGYTPLLKTLYNYVPGFNMMRGNAKVLFLTTFSLSCLSGFGAQAIRWKWHWQRKWLIRVFFIIIVSSLLIFLIYVFGITSGGDQSSVWRSLLNHRKAIDRDAYWRVLDNPLFTSQAYLMFRSGVVRLLLFLGLTVFVFLLAMMKRRSLMFINALVIAVVVADLWSFDAPFLSTLPVSACWWPQDVTDFFKKDRSMFRYYKDIRVNSVCVNQNMNNGFFSEGGYEPDLVNAYKEFLYSMRVIADNAVGAMTDKNRSDVIAMMNLKYFIVPAGTAMQDPIHILRLKKKGFEIYENKGVLARAYIVHGAKIIKEPSFALDYIKGENFRPGEQVVLYEATGYQLPDYGTASKTEDTEILSYNPNGIVIRCSLQERGLLFLSDTYYPGWRVTVDGQPGRILRANYAFRAVPLDKGTHMVRFSYQPASFKWGAALSLLTLMAVLILLFISTKN